MSRIVQEMTRTVEQCRREATATGRTTRGVAQDTIRVLPDGPLLRRMAAEWLVEVIARAAREDSLAVERAAEIPAAGRGTTPHTIRPRRGTKAYSQWVQTTPEGHRWETERVEAEATFMSRSITRITELMGTFADELRMEWTDELLTTGFALPDGTLVTWGEATIDQHTARRDMFLTNAQANVDGAARHERAIRDIQRSGATRLADLVKVAS